MYYESVMPKTALLTQCNAAPAEMPKQYVRLQQLDFLRGIAILLVILNHCPVSREDAGWAWPVGSIGEHVGWTGVDLFFVLSGFLVGGLLIRELRETNSLQIFRFLIRRGLKIWPAYAVFLAYLFITLISERGLHEGFTSLIPNFLHVQNYFAANMPRPHTWSLAVEEHFYLTLPILLTLTWRHRMGRANLVVVLLVACMIASGTCRVAQYLTSPSDDAYRWYTHNRVDSLFFGVLLAYIGTVSPQLLTRIASKPGLLLAMTFLFMMPLLLTQRFPIFFALRYTSLYLSYGALVILCVYGASPWLIKVLTMGPSRLIAFIGTFSYSIYLWHVDIIQLLEKNVKLKLGAANSGAHYVTFVLIAILVASAAGMAFAKIVEFPVLALRDRFFPSAFAAKPRSS